MDANNIKYIVAIAKHGSINHAAKAMFISQPQLSHILKATEDECGFTLFQRTSRGTRLTPAGEDYLQHCEIILQEMAKLNHFVSRAVSTQSRLNVSMTRFSHTSECFNEICKRHQDAEHINYHLREDSPANVIDDVAESRSTIGVIHFSATDRSLTLQNLEHKNLELFPLATFRPYVCLSAEHPLLANQSRFAVDISELRHYGFVRYEGQYEDFIYHIATGSGLVDLNESQKIIYVCDRQEQMRLISCTSFFTIGISEFSGQSNLYHVVSIPLLHCSEQLSFGIVTRKNAALSPVEKEFFDTVVKRYHALKEQK